MTCNESGIHGHSLQQLILSKSRLRPVVLSMSPRIDNDDGFEAELVSTRCVPD